MRVVVCCKAVPVDVTPDSVQIIDGDIHCTSGDLYINEIDEYALEAALSLKKSCDIETWAVTVGPLRAQEALYLALAKGIDNVLRIGSEVGHPELVAGALIAAFKELQPQLIFVGVQSEDWMGGEIGAYIAEGLGASLGFAVVEITELNDSQIRVKKEIGGGRKIEMLLKLPAVLCVQTGIQPLQYVSALRRKKVRDNPVKLWGKLEEIDIRQNIIDMLKYQVERVSIPEEGAQAVMISGETPEKAKEVLKILRENLTV